MSGKNRIKLTFCKGDIVVISFVIMLAVLIGVLFVKTTGTDIDKLMPPMTRFGGGNRAEKKQGIIAKFLTFFEKYFGIS